MSPREFADLSPESEWLFRHTLLTEEAIGRLEAAIYALRDRVAKMETALAETAAKLHS
jgi:hypothetical protein